MKKLIILLLILLLCCTALAEKSFEQIDEEFDMLMEEYSKFQAVKDVLYNGLRTYPDQGYEGEYAFTADVIFPSDALDRESGKSYCGKPYLLTGTCIDVKGYGIDFLLDDGRLAIVAFDYFDYDAGELIDLGNHPKKDTRCNVYCTFSNIGLELISKNCLHFTAGVTEKVKQICLEKAGL